MSSLNLTNVKGLTPEELEKVKRLEEVYKYHLTKNETKQKYYEGQIPLGSVNLGIALPDNLNKLTIGCEWGAKTVDVLGARSMFDGFVSKNGQDNLELSDIVEANNLVSQYIKACKDELKFGCTFATLSADEDGGCKIRFHSPMTATALWNGEKGRIDCGFAIIDTVPDEKLESTWTPCHVNLYTDYAIIELHRDRAGGQWRAVRKYSSMGRPLMVPMIWNATSDKPFGRSRIKNTVRSLIDSYVRTLADMTIALEFATTPQKYILGITDEQYDVMIADKFKQYAGSILAATSNPDTGANPTVGQFAQGSVGQHVEMIRVLATQFSATTGLSVTDTGVVNDANPTSSDAILAQSQTLTLLAEQLNSGNGDALKQIAIMALAISKNVTLDELEENETDIIAHFKNPAMPSVSMTADAAIKIASAREGFSGTDTFLEMIGFTQADIRRIRAQEQSQRGRMALEEFLTTPEEGGEENATEQSDLA